MLVQKSCTLRGQAPLLAQRCTSAVYPAYQARISLRNFQVYATKEDDKPADDGDNNVQDALLGMLRLEIGKKKVEEYVEEGGDKLKQIAEEAKEEMDKMAELSRMRADIAFDSALADINREAAEFEEQLRKSREELLASEQEFNQWEDDMAATRSEGQFFQTLYQKDKKKPAGFNAEQLQERAERARKVTEPAKKEIGSPVRFYLYMFLTTILLADVAADLLSEQQSAGPDVLYVVLAFLAGFLAYNERKSLE